MSTTWKAQIAKDDYNIQFHTDDYQKYKYVEAACVDTIDNTYTDVEEETKRMKAIKEKELLVIFFDKWKSDKIKEFQGTQDLCKHSTFDGLCGFSGWAGCNIHWDDGVHYGSRGCPENCPDFELADEDILCERCLEDLRKYIS